MLDAGCIHSIWIDQGTSQSWNRLGQIVDVDESRKVVKRNLPPTHGALHCTCTYTTVMCGRSDGWSTPVLISSMVSSSVLLHPENCGRMREWVNRILIGSIMVSPLDCPEIPIADGAPPLPLAFFSFRDGRGTESRPILHTHTHSLTRAHTTHLRRLGSAKGQQTSVPFWQRHRVETDESWRIQGSRLRTTTNQVN
jgi:hypothetical protein